MKHRFYSEYKPSGVEWLGDVPKHWKLKRLRFFAHINPVKSQVAELLPDTEVSFVPMEAVQKNGAQLKNPGVFFGGLCDLRTLSSAFICLKKVRYLCNFSNGRGVGFKKVI